jgi:predicted esterase
MKAQPAHIEFAPSATYLFGQRDTAALYMDVYDPAPGSQTSFEGCPKPTILWLCGGGFISGDRANPAYLSWFEKLTGEGYRVVSADYVPALKGKQLKYSLWTMVHNAHLLLDACMNVGVQDCFAAVRFLLDNSDALGIDPAGIVLAGSSAGALIALTAEWELSCRMPNAKVLPEDFYFAGVMSFAGGVIGNRGTPRWDREPSHLLLFHGVEDGLVPYTGKRFFRLGLFGSSSLADALTKQGYPYWIVRLVGHGHDVSECMIYLWDWEKAWLEQNVMQCSGRCSDETLYDPSIPAWWKGDINDYK